MKAIRIFATKREKGAALVVSLLFLLIMTIIGVAGMQATSLEEKMTGNMRDRSLAFQAAESALRSCENLLNNPPAALVFPPTANPTQGLYNCQTSPPTNPPCPSLQGNLLSDSFWSNAANAVTYVDPGGGILANVASAPQCIIEKLPDIPVAPFVGTFYRVTGRGTGGTANAVVIVQSTYLK